jgi:hypothetical protein
VVLEKDYMTGSSVVFETPQGYSTFGSVSLGHPFAAAALDLKVEAQAEDHSP